MKRKAFILLAATGVLGVAIPITLRWEELAGWGSPFAQPRLLSSVTNRKDIKSLGKLYVQLFPHESNYNILFNLLSDKNSGTARMSESDTRMIRSQMDRKITDDFRNERTLILNGWVVSITEARQCALYFLLQS